MKEHERIVLQKIRKYAVQAIQFRGNMGFEEFSGELKTVTACVFSLSQIGELAGRLDNAFAEKTNHIPWRKIKDMRNRIVHDYEGIQLNIVWDVLTDFLPRLIDEIDELIR